MLRKRPILHLLYFLLFGNFDNLYFGNFYKCLNHTTLYFAKIDHSMNLEKSTTPRTLATLFEDF